MMMQFKNLAMCIFFMTGISSTYAFDYCSNIPGPWDGNAKINYNVRNRTYQCEYITDVTMSTPVDDRSHFNANMNFKLASGSCLPRFTLQLSGTCDGTTGLITIQTNDADLLGQLSDNSMFLLINGTVTLPILNVPATVEALDLNKR